MSAIKLINLHMILFIIYAFIFYFFSKQYPSFELSHNSQIFLFFLSIHNISTSSYFSLFFLSHVIFFIYIHQSIPRYPFPAYSHSLVFSIMPSHYTSSSPPTNLRHSLSDLCILLYNLSVPALPILPLPFSPSGNPLHHLNFSHCHSLPYI